MAKKLGFYEIQDLEKRIWDANDKGSTTPVLTLQEEHDLIAEVWRLRHLVVAMKEMVEDALPDHTTNG